MPGSVNLKIIWPLLYALTLALVVIRPAKADPPAIFDNPVTIRITNAAQPALILDASGVDAHGAWIQYVTKCYGYPGPCEFGGLEWKVLEADGSVRAGDTPRFNYSSHSDALEFYGWHGCVYWVQQGLLRFCGPNGTDITTAVGGLALRPWRNLELAPNECAAQGACAPTDYHTFVAGQMAVGTCDNTAAGRLFTVCGNEPGNVISRLINEGSGGVAKEYIANTYAAQHGQTLAPDGTWIP